MYYRANVRKGTIDKFFENLALDTKALRLQNNRGSSSKPFSNRNKLHPILFRLYLRVPRPKLSLYIKEFISFAWSVEVLGVSLGAKIYVYMR